MCLQQWGHPLLVKCDITTPYAQNKRARACARQGARTQDLAGTDLAGARDKQGGRTRDPVGACTRVQAHARDHGMSIGTIQSKIHMRI